MQTLDDGMYHACRQDEQGSTVFITGDGGEVENSYVYDAFGNVLERKEGIRNDILYRGQQYDQEAGQYYLRARYYNPVIGKFIQEDTYRGDGLNLYAYCGNNPVMYYDPSGHTKVTPPTAEPEAPMAAEGGNKTELFLPDEFYNKNLPSQVEPGIKYLPKYDELGNVKQIKMYDDYGREIGWVDYTNHGYGNTNFSNYYTTPHWHEIIYNAQYLDGKK